MYRVTVAAKVVERPFITHFIWTIDVMLGSDSFISRRLFPAVNFPEDRVFPKKAVYFPEGSVYFPGGPFISQV